jgi:WD40 repeat protein
MISFFSLKSLSLIVNDDEEDTHYMNGISSSSNNVSIGSSTGHILIIEYNKGRKEFHEKQKLFTINNPITALAQSNIYLVCANGDGDVFVFDSTDEYKLLGQYKGSGFTCTCLGIKGDIIIAGYITGHIKLFNANDIEVFIEITAHIRMITGMDVHPNENIFITCSEDHYVQVWALPIRLTSSSIINTIFTRKLENKLCTGIAFLSDGRICVSSYDDNELNIFVKQ